MLYSVSRKRTFDLTLSMPELTGFLTTQEAAALLGFHVNHVRRMIKRGDLISKRVGHMLFVSSESVKGYKEKTEGFSKFDNRKRVTHTE